MMVQKIKQSQATQKVLAPVGFRAYKWTAFLHLCVNMIVEIIFVI